MNAASLRHITDRYTGLHIAVVGDFCLDRYLEIDPARQETSIETLRPVHNVVRVRSLPGGAGTIVNNLAALGVGRITPVGFCGDDGEGYELRRALAAVPGVSLDHFTTSPERRTFTYCKPLVVAPGREPLELDRLDSKNWTRTPAALESTLARATTTATASADAVIVLEQVDHEATGTITPDVLAALASLAASRPALPILADSRRGLEGWPPLSLKMNGQELSRLAGRSHDTPDLLSTAASLAAERARANARPVFVTLSERGILAASPDGRIDRSDAHPVRGPIDVVGAGDAVTANLAAALAGGASIPDALQLAMAAASVVVHKLGTTGTATPHELALALGFGNLSPA
jgi:rfaE bifunctional protein kinase chain/domain